MYIVNRDHKEKISSVIFASKRNCLFLQTHAYSIIFCFMLKKLKNVKVLS